MFGRFDRLVSTQHDEVMACLRGRDKELREEFKQRREEAKRRDEEAKRRDEEFKQRQREFEEESQRRDEEMREEFKRRDEEMREFNREILLRNEKVYTAMIAQLEENTEQTRANTKAVLSVLDRFEDAA